MPTMSVEKQFSKYANDYNNYNIIQQLIAKSLIRDIKEHPKRILELGCGSGQIYKRLNWEIEYYKAIDFSSSMCELHPHSNNVEVKCFDFDSEEFFEDIKNEKYDAVISSSAMQWSKNLSKLISRLLSVSSNIYTVLFTSNTFKTIQKISGNTSPILSVEQIKEAFASNGEFDYEVLNYKLYFDNKKELFDYIKKSGVSGDSNLSFKDAKKLYKEYPYSYLEFEVIFVKTFSKS